ncbi:MAG: hypothetical protein ACRC46_13610 [Thermoguttaceae bacterium]
MTASIAEIQEVLDQVARYNAEAARRDVEAADRAAEAEKRAAESNAAAEKQMAGLRALLDETARLAKERDAKYNSVMEAERKKTDAAIRKVSNEFHDKWSRLVEALVKNQVIPLLNSRGIPIQRTLEREKGCVNGQNFEFDIIAKNGDSIVIIEVKTTLRPDDVKEFHKELLHAKEWLPEYAHLTIYGAVAFLHSVSEAEQFAQKKGLFTILATGKGATITNPESFKPNEW